MRKLLLTFFTLLMLIACKEEKARFDKLYEVDKVIIVAKSDSCTVYKKWNGHNDIYWSTCGGLVVR